MIGPIKKLWNVVIWIAGGYSVYNHLKTLNMAKDDLYSQLSPEQQAEWSKIFGLPGGTPIENPQLPPVKMKVAQSGPSDIEQVIAGT